MAKNRITPEGSQKSKDEPKSIENSRKNVPVSSRSDFFVKPKRKPKGSSFTPDHNLKLKTKYEKGEDNDEVQPKREKKPFDKKTYRLKKYSKKYKLQQWEDTRKKAVLRDFYKQVKDGNQEFDVAKIYNDPRNQESDEEFEDGIQTKNSTKVNTIVNEIKEETSSSEVLPKKKQKPFYRAREEFKRLKESKEKKSDEFLKRKLEKEEALKKYRKEKALKYKKLSRKTKKGQPIMKDRLEMLLEKIQKMN